MEMNTVVWKDLTSRFKTLHLGTPYEIPVYRRYRRREAHVESDSDDELRDTTIAYLNRIRRYRVTAKEVKIESNGNICNYKLPSVRLSGFKPEKIDLSTLNNNEELYKFMGFIQFRRNLTLENP